MAGSAWLTGNVPTGWRKIADLQKPRTLILINNRPQAGYSDPQQPKHYVYQTYSTETIKLRRIKL